MLYWARLYTWSVWLFYARTLHFFLRRTSWKSIFSSCLQWTFHLAVCLKPKSFWCSYATRIHLYTRFWRLKRDLFAFDQPLPELLSVFNIVCNHLLSQIYPSSFFFFLFHRLFDIHIAYTSLHNSWILECPHFLLFSPKVI